MTATYLALTIFADAANTIVDRVVQFEDGQFWLDRAAEFVGHTVREGDIILGVRVDRIGDEVEAWG